MTTRTADPLAPLLDRLFAEADAAEPEIDAAFSDLSDEEQTRMLRSKTDYGELYGRMKDLPLAVSRETGALLYMLAKSSGARDIVEFGTSFGISTVHLAAALRDNGGGRLIGSELEAGKVAQARANLTAAGFMARTIPNARKSVIPHANHAANLHKPQAVNATIRDYLRRLPP